MGRHIAAVNGGAVGGEQAAGFLQVLDAHWKPVQQPQRMPCQDRPLGRRRLLPGPVEAGRGDRIDMRIDFLYPRYAGFQQLYGRYLFAAD